MKLFGLDFELLDEAPIRELFSLEREGAIYTDLWIDRLEDFRHVKIAFTEAETEEYVRSLWAYELFLRAGSPQLASEVPGIPEDIAKRADTYSLHTVDGQELGPPYHCVAGFLGEDLEVLVCCPPESRMIILEEAGSAALISTLKRAIDSLTPSIRCFNNREKGLTPWPVACEDDVRDLLYAMLRASIEDIRTEEPVPTRGGRYEFVDLYSELARLFVEVKWIGRTGRWKEILKQINDDTQSYVAHPYCRTLVFVIIDVAKDIPDPALLERDLTGTQIIAGKEVEVLAFVREP